MGRTEVKDWEEITERDYPNIAKEGVDISSILEMMQEMKEKMEENQKTYEDLVQTYEKKLAEKDEEWTKRLNDVQKGNLDKNLEAHKKQIESLEKQNKESQNVIKSYGDYLESKDNEIEGLNNKISRLETEIQTIKEESKKSIFQKTKEHMQKSLQEVKDNLKTWNDKCRTALHKFKENTKADIFKTAKEIQYDVQRDYLYNKVKNKEENLRILDAINQKGIDKNIEKQNKKIIRHTRWENMKAAMRGEDANKQPELITKDNLGEKETGIHAMIDKYIVDKKLELIQARDKIAELDAEQLKFMDEYEARKQEIEDYGKVIEETEINKETGVSQKDMENIHQNMDKNDWDKMKEALEQAGYSKEEAELRTMYMQRGKEEMDLEIQKNELQEQFKENVSQEKFEKDTEVKNHDTNEEPDLEILDDDLER